MLQSILFTHDDMDGRGCEIIFKLAQEAMGCNADEDYEVVVCSNNNIDEKVESTLTYARIDDETEIIFSDICPHKETIKMLLEKVERKELERIKVYDHHKSNEWVMDLIPDAVVTVSDPTGKMESGTSLIYYAYADKLAAEGYDMDYVGKLVDAIRSYDTYEWKETNNIIAKKLNILFGLIGGDKFVDKYYTNIILKLSGMELIGDHDSIFVDCKYDAEINAINKVTPDDMIIVKIHGYKVALLTKSIPASMSELGYTFLKRYPEVDVFVAFNLYDGGKFSIRTQRDDIDVSKIFSAPLGGGGHAKASGASLPKPMKKAINDIIIRSLGAKKFMVELRDFQDAAYVNNGESTET